MIHVNVVAGHRLNCVVIAVVAAVLLVAQASFAQEREIGLLELPELFGLGACDQVKTRPITLRSSPGGPVVGTALVVKPHAISSQGGCEPATVGVRMAGKTATQDLPTAEFGYEAPGVIVYEQRGKWFRIRIPDGSAWLEATGDEDEFYSLELLFAEHLTSFTDAWDGSVASAPGAEGRRVSGVEKADGQAVKVRSSIRVKGSLWFLVNVLSRSGCEGDGEPTVLDSGWVPAYNPANATTIQIHARGC
jgi:hypothetical protein